MDWIRDGGTEEYRRVSSERCGVLPKHRLGPLSIQAKQRKAVVRQAKQKAPQHETVQPDQVQPPCAQPPTQHCRCARRGSWWLVAPHATPTVDARNALA
jgi:hypothetical protein